MSEQQLAQEQLDWLTHARIHGYYGIADNIERQWKMGRMGQVDARTPMPGLKRDLDRINKKVARGEYNNGK